MVYTYALEVKYKIVWFAANVIEANSHDIWLHTHGNCVCFTHLFDNIQSDASLCKLKLNNMKKTSTGFDTLSSKLSASDENDIKENETRQKKTL